MASEIRSFTDPSSLAAFGNLVQGEQTSDLLGRQLGQQAGLAQQQMALDQQRMAQQYDLAQQEMAQQQGQFTAGLLEQQRQRDFATGEREASQRFDAEQADALRKWQEGKIQEQRKFELQLQAIEAQVEEAEATGNAEAAARLTAEGESIRLRAAKAADDVARATVLQNTTKANAARVISQYENKIGERVRVIGSAIDIGNQFAPTFVDSVFGRTNKNSAAALETFRNQGMASIGGMYTSGDIASDYTEALQGNMPGADLLVLGGGIADSVQAIGRGFMPGETPTAGFVKGKLDNVALADKQRAVLTESLVESIAGIPGLKSIDQDAVRGVVSDLLAGGDSAQIQQKIAASGLDPYTLRQILRGAAEQMSTSKSDSRMGKMLADLMAKEASSTGGQSSLRSASLAAARDYYEGLSTMLRRAAGRLTLASPEELQVGMGRLKSSMELGQLIGESELARTMSPADMDILRKALADQRSAAETQAAASAEQGRAAEESAAFQRNLALAPLVAKGRGSKVRRAGVEGLLGETGR
jgi:hypothetical protein